VKLDAQTVADLTLPAGKTDQIFFDDDLPGFGFRIRAGGRRTFIAQYRVRGRTRRQTIGARLNAEEARKAARRILAAVEMGGDPQADKIASRLKAARTLKAVAANYLAAKKTELRPASYRGAELYLQRGAYFAALHPVAISDVTLEDVATCVSAVARDHGSSSAKLARSYLSRMFGWAMGEGLCTANPVVGTNKPQTPTSRERVLSNTEIAAIWNATGAGSDYARIIRLLLLTGARREEIGGLRWSEVDLDRATITLPKERTKNEHAHIIALTEPVLEILKGARDEQPQERVFVFGAGGAAGFSRWAHNKQILDGVLGAGVTPWRLHDLRRTMATGMGEVGVQPHIVEAVLNHFERNAYNWAVYESEKHSAWVRWATHVLDIAAGKSQKVVALRSA
jgi:integrase